MSSQPVPWHHIVLRGLFCLLATSALNKAGFVARLTINCEGQKADECGGIVVNRTNPRVFLDNLEFRYVLSTMYFVGQNEIVYHTGSSACHAR